MTSEEQDAKDVKEPEHKESAKVRRAVYECVDARCTDGGERSRDVLKLFPEEPLPQMIGCYNCHGGLQGTGPAPRPGGMKFVEYEAEDGAEAESETDTTVH